MRAPVRTVRAGVEGDAVAVEPQARSVRHPQQRSRDASAALQLARLAHVAGHVDRVVSRGGEARGDVAGRSGRLAPRALGRAPPAAPAARAPPPHQRALAARQNSAREARRARPLRHHRSAETARLLRYSIPLVPQLQM